MINDAAPTVPNGATLHADVCVVGGGPVGLALSTELGSAQCRVIVLESGGRIETPAGHALAGADQFGDLWEPIARTRTRALGGTSSQWTSPDHGMPHDGLRSHPLTSVDFQARPWVADSGWPFGRESLTPFYERAQGILQLGPFDYGPPNQPPLTLAPSEVETTQVRFSSRAAAERLETLVTQSPHIEVLLNCTGLVLDEDDDGRVWQIRVRSGDREFAVEARCFVLAAGGIENARLLLLSDEQTPGGIGNRNDLVGRYFMEHLTVTQGMIAGAQAAASFGKVTVDGVPVQPVWRIAEDVVRREELLGAVLVPVPADAVSGRFFARNAYLRPLSRLVRRPLGPLRRHLLHAPAMASMAGRGVLGLAKPYRAIGIHAHIEQPPRRENRVTLSKRNDALGQRQARVEWRLGTQERNSLLRTLTLFDAALRTGGLGRLVQPPTSANFDLLVEQSHHHMGTTRMHADPTHGVVDADCRVHGVSNLYVAGSSVMPTGGAATVTLTAVALGLRLADHLRKRLGTQG